MNRPESLDRTLKLMSEADDVPLQIIIVDQSDDKRIRQQNETVLNHYTVFYNRKYIYQETPSITKARNNGFAEAKNEILVFSDDDVDVDKLIFTSIVKLMSDEKIAMIAGIDDLNASSKTNIGYLLGTKSFFKRKIGHVTRSMLGRFPDNIKVQTATQWAQGYFFVVRKSCLDRWNIKWDEHLTSYAYAEDLDFSYSYYKCAQRDGMRCVLDPFVHVKHLASLEYRVPNAKSIYMYIVNRKYLAYKHKMGLLGALGRNWCELWRLVQHIIANKSPKIFVKAFLSKFKYSKDIIAGNLDYEKFMR